MEGLSPSIVMAIVAASAALVGVLIGNAINRDATTVRRLRYQNQKLRTEVRARIAQENIVCDMLVEAKVFSTSSTAKIALRNAVDKAEKIRPRMRPSDVV